MKEEFNKNIINSHLDNNLTDEDRVELKEWLKLPDNKEAVKEADYLRMVNITESNKIADTDGEWDKFMSNKFKQNNSNNGSAKVLNLISKIAAVLFLPLLITLYYVINDSSSEIVKFEMPKGNKGKVFLNDGTKVWLNSGSSLNYTVSSDMEMREVFLKGEAYFNVNKSDKPFVVKTSLCDIKVYGTQFNVRAYENSGVVETVLKEGSVGVTTLNDKRYMLKPNQMIVVDESGAKLSKVNPKHFISWKDNVLRMRNVKLSQLKIELERWYGVDINIEDFEKHKDNLYTLTIKTESLKEMLEFINIATPMEYEISGDMLWLRFVE